MSNDNQRDSTVAMSSASVSPATWAMDDEIDLRQYIQVVINWWREIALITVAVVVATVCVLLLYTLTTPPVYEAAATVAIARVKSDITFDERYRTLSEEELQQLRGDARRSALLGLVRNTAVANAVITELSAQLSEDERNPALLLEQVTGRLVSLESGGSDSDLISIVVRSESPDHSALIANAWAKQYVQHVNTLYGSVPAELMTSVGSDLALASSAYQQAQQNLESFIADDNASQLERQIAEKESVLSTIQIGRQSALQALIDKEMAARQEIAAAYINALAENRLLGFEKEQEAKRQVVAAYIDSELDARLSAYNNDRRARQVIYNRLVDAELGSVLAIFDRQVQDQLGQLARSYEEKQRLETLLVGAQTLRTQVENGGDAAAVSNRIAVTLLKTQVLSATASLPGMLQLNVDAGADQPVSATEQASDLSALVSALEDRLTTLSSQITDQSTALAAGEGYQFLDLLGADQLASTISSDGAGGVDAQTDATVRSLKEAIVARYNDLYEIGSIAETGQALTVDSEIFDEIRSLYPELFRLDDLSQLAEDGTGDSPLSLLTQSEAAQLLQLQTLDNLTSFETVTTSLDQTLEVLEAELQDLRSLYEARTARQQQLVQQRDLAWTTFTTLSNKSVELNLSNTAANSEVRFAAPAIPPVEPVEEFSLTMIMILAAVLGGVLALFVALLSNFLGVQPFLNRTAKVASAR